ncbi:hypothetical protein FJTKL_12635 [Diaporthe vaccinii]|uniref:Uncharacterized protein n=1 Tax=Diaporthe vaccinii TaxID=105482 RepID=A0ABR4ED87_9PEZI
MQMTGMEPQIADLDLLVRTRRATAGFSQWSVESSDSSDHWLRVIVMRETSDQLVCMGSSPIRLVMNSLDGVFFSLDAGSYLDRAR